MLEAGLAQLRIGASLLFGARFSLRSFDHIIAALQATQREFGSITAEGKELLTGPTLDEETRRDMQLRRFRGQAVRAARETDYYQRLFTRLSLDPRRLTYADIATSAAHAQIRPATGSRRICAAAARDRFSVP